MHPTKTTIVTPKMSHHILHSPNNTSFANPSYSSPNQFGCFNIAMCSLIYSKKCIERGCDKHIKQSIAKTNTQSFHTKCQQNVQSQMHSKSQLTLFQNNKVQKDPSMNFSYNCKVLNILFFNCPCNVLGPKESLNNFYM